MVEECICYYIQTARSIGECSITQFVKQFVTQFVTYLGFDDDHYDDEDGDDDDDTITDPFDNCPLGLPGWQSTGASDYDRDGLIDVVISTHNGPPLLLHNTSSTEGHWLQIELVGREQNKWAVGAKVSVHTESGPLVRTHLAGESYLSANSSRLHFGLGSIETALDVEVRWPSGEITRIKEIPIDRTIRLRQDTNAWEEVPLRPSTPRPWGQ